MYRYSGNESPDPLASCPGYKGAVGLPLLIRRDHATEIASAQLVEVGGKVVRLCVFTESTYTSSDAGEQEFVRFVMRNSAVVMEPALSDWKQDTPYSTTPARTSTTSLRSEVWSCTTYPDRLRRRDDHP